MTTASIKNLRLAVKVSNNQLKERRETMGLTAPQFAARFDINYGAYNKLENLKASPLTAGKRGGFGRPVPITWRPIALAVAEAHRVTPDILWPDSILAIEKVDAEIRLDAEEVAALVKSASAPSPFILLENEEKRAAIENALATLSPREERVLRMRFGFGDSEYALAGVGEEFELSVERIRQIEARALRKLRHPSRAWPIAAAWWGEKDEPPP